MKIKYEIIPILFWVALSLLVMTFSHKLNLGDFQNPGPGLMPFLFGATLLLISLVLIVKLIPKFREKSEREHKAQKEKGNFLKVGLVSGALFVYVFLLEKLGYLITASLVVVFLFKIAGSPKWRPVLIASAITIIVSYVAFTLLGVRFPVGVLGTK